MAQAAQEISQRTGGKINLEQFKGVIGGRAGSSSAGKEDLEDGIGYQEPGRELSHETMSAGVGYSDRGELSDPFVSFWVFASDSIGSSQLHRKKTSLRV